MDTEIRLRADVDPGEEHSPAAPAGTRTCDLLITNETGAVPTEIFWVPFSWNFPVR